jgi:hypothetical protein
MPSRSFGSHKPKRSRFLRPGNPLGSEIADLRADVEDAFVSIEEEIDNGGGGGGPGPNNYSVTVGNFTSAGGSLLATHVIVDVDTTGGQADIALPAFGAFAGDRAFVIHKRTSDANPIRLTGFAVNGSASPYTLPGSDGAFGTWFLRRNAAGTWFVSPGSVDDIIVVPSGAQAGDLLYYDGSEFVRLAIGNDGDVLTLASGLPEWVAAAAGGGGLPAISYLTGWDVDRYYDMGSDPITGQANWGIAGLVYAESSESVTRMLFGNDGGFGGGASIIINGEAITGRVTDSGSNLRQLASFNPPMVNKWLPVFLRGITVAGTDLRAQLYIGGSLFQEVIQSAVTASVQGGGNFMVGGRRGSPSSQPALYDRIAGVGVAQRNVTPAQIAEWSRAVVAAGQMVDIPSGGSFTAAWRVGAAEPGATWAPFVGAGNLTRVGTALTRGADSAVVYR